MPKTPDTLRSARWFAPDDLRSMGHRSRLMQMGYGPADWAGKPVIAIVNTWSDINQCHTHFKQRVEDVKRGVLQAGGFPLELPAMSLSEPIVKPTTMLYRNFLAMETEELLRCHPVDGAVLMGGCDKTTPGLLMGAFSAGLPCIFLPAGPMLRGNWKGKVLGSGSDTWKYWDERRAGKISDAQWAEVEAGIARSHGTCMTMGTAATMMGIAEALGLTLPGASSIPAADANHPRMSADCGRRIVQMVWDDLRPPALLTRAHFLNAINVAMAMGCSTNAIIHLVAMSRRAGADCTVTLDDFDAASRKVPVLANIRPSGDTYLMEDFYYAGGLPGLLSRLRGHLDLGTRTVNGRTLGENIAGAEVYDDDVIRPLDQPIYAEGALAVLRGNLAPDGCVIKPSACAPHLLQHRGPALVFDDYPALKKAIDDPDLEVTRRPCAGAALRRPAGRAGHARVGHAADPDQAGEGGREGHAAPVGRAHERHQLRRVHAALRARGLRRRAAGAAAHRRRDRGRRAGPAHPPRRGRRRTGAPPRRLDATTARATNAATAGCSRATSCRPTRAATSTSSKPASARRWPNPTSSEEGRAPSLNRSLTRLDQLLEVGECCSPLLRKDSSSSFSSLRWASVIFTGVPLRHGVQVDGIAGADFLDALAAQAEGLAVLRAFGQLDLGLAAECRHLDGAAQRHRGQAHRHGAVQVVTVALEDVVRLDADFDVQVAGLAAIAAGIAVAGRADAPAFVDPEGIFTSSVFCFLILPAPLQVVQGSGMILPVPRQCGQVCWMLRKPWRICNVPLPLQVPQILGLVPGLRRCRCRSRRCPSWGCGSGCPCREPPLRG